MLKNLAEFWSSLGSKMKASLTVTVTISVPVFADITDFLVTTHTTSYSTGSGIPPETVQHVGGRVLDQMSTALSGALVDLLEAGLSATTDADGQFDFQPVVPGTYNIRVAAVGFKPLTQSVNVPGLPGEYVINLTPL
jgi:protocatechuate 3,4-dioxygenase beta subunit